ncbi:unnamed protein product, partial [Phaeothamnion confervicola]
MLPPHEVVGLPALSPTMETGTITEWKVKDGAAFGPGDIICLVETDKATVDFEAQEDGFVAKILVPAGTADVKVGQPIMVTVERESDTAAFASYAPDGADAAAAPPAPAPVPAPEPAPAAAPAPVPAPATAPPAPAPANVGGRLFASPLARKLAVEHGIDITAVSGTGPNGRVIAADVREYEPATAAMAAATAEAPAAAAAAPMPVPKVAGPAGVAGEGYVDFPVSEASREIAARMAKTMQTVPHYYLSVDIKLDKI